MKLEIGMSDFTPAPRIAVPYPRLSWIVHNSYEVLIGGKIPMRERHGLRNQEG